jgi:hypothetical protein
MGLFSFFEKQVFPDVISEVPVGDLLQQQLDLLPDYYRRQPQFTRCIESLARHKQELALESPIALTVEIKHSLSPHYWATLAQIADKLQLPARARYCLQQQKATRAIGFQTPVGWTTVKVDDIHYQHYIAESIKEGWASKRRQQDNVEQKRQVDGFYQCAHGRGGMIYYV